MRRVHQVIPIVPAAAAEEKGVGLYAAHQKVYTRSVSGVFARWRWAMVFVTQLVFYGLPWLEWGQRQAVLFDLGARRFYVLGLVLYPQDLIYLTGLLVVSALSLFWSIPSSFLAGTSVAVGIAGINCVGNLAGFVSPYVVGWLNVTTHDNRMGLYFVAVCLVLGALLVRTISGKLADR